MEKNKNKSRYTIEDYLEDISDYSENEFNENNN